MPWQPESSGYGKCSKTPDLSCVPDEGLVCPQRHPRVSPTRMSCVPDEKSGTQTKEASYQHFV